MPPGVNSGLALGYARCNMRAMTLDEYLRTADTNAAKLAEAVGISPASITRIRQGKQNIKLDLARSIVDKTGGAVTLNDLATERAA